MSEFATDAIARGLQRASDDIKREVGALIPEAALEMERRLVSRYPIGAKHDPRVPRMRDDVRIRSGRQQDALLPVRKVVGPHLAYIWQDGTKERYDSTRRNARRGRMPAADPHFFERTAVEIRSRMLASAQSVLDRDREIA